MKKSTKFIFLFVAVLFLIGVAGVALVFMNASNGPVFLDGPAPQLGVTVDKNNIVIDVLANSPAARAGVQRGDVLTKVGTYSVTATTNTREIVQSAIQASTILVPENGIERSQVQALPVVVNRNGVQLTLSVMPVAPPFNYANNNLPLPTPTPAPSNLIHF